MNIPIARPSIDADEIKAVTEVLESGNLASGTRVALFEEKFASYCRTHHAIATNNGTSALHAALVSLGIRPGDEIIVPSFSFIATATSVSMSGGTPIFADVDTTTYTLDPSSVLERITPKTRAVIGVHLFGHPFPIHEIKELCNDHNLFLVEDAAQAHGSSYCNKKIGSFGDVSCFSFYATKNMTTGEGGMITTNNDAISRKSRQFINHGQIQKYVHESLGYNYRLTDIGAAIGIVQLAKLDQMNEKRIKIASYYTNNIRGAELIHPTCKNHCVHVYHQYVIQVKSENPTERREAILEHLRKKGIGTAVHYPIPIHRQPVYFKKFMKDPCPNSSSMSNCVFSLPIHPMLTGEEIEYISNSLNEVLK